MDTTTILKPEDFLPYFQMLEKAKAGPSKLLLKALGLIDSDQALSPRPDAALAVDLGCGNGKDTAELLRRNWRVLAIDFSQVGIDTLLARPEASQHKDRLETRVASFSATSWSNATLVSALLSLPYGPPETFDSVWQAVVSSLVPGGYFVGQLFGPDHYKGMNHVVRRSKSEVDVMLAGLEVLHLEEISQVTEHAGEKTYYHFFEIIARKPAPQPAKG
jgi:SAM-dependent methyltransferase